MRPRHRLLIAHTWQGTPLRAREHVLLAMRLTPRAMLINVDAPFHDDPPPPGPPGPTPRLWEHEVVELFLSGPGEPDHVPYTEIELSPRGHHLVLQLVGIRRPVAEGLPMRFRSRILGERWHGCARLDRRLLPPLPWRVNAFAVHGRGAGRRFLSAAPMPGPRPDFHQPHRFPDLSLGNAEVRLEPPTGMPDPSAG